MDGSFLLAVFIVGFVMVIASVMWFSVDLRKSRELFQKAEADKGELLSLMTDVESLLGELNYVSNNLFKKINKKNSEAALYINRLNGALQSAAPRRGGAAAATGGAAVPAGGAAAENGGAAAAYGEAAGDMRADAGAAAPDGGWMTLNRRDDGRLYGRRFNSSHIRRYIGERAGGGAGDETGGGTGSETGGGAGGNAGAAEAAAAEGVADAAFVRASRDVPDAAFVRGVRDAPSAPGLPGAPGAGTRADDYSRHARRAAPAPRGRKYAEVLRCDREGMNEAEIARFLNIGRGEVELILGLREVI